MPEVPGGAGIAGIPSAEAAPRPLEERLAAVLAAVDAGVWLVDLASGTMAWSGGSDALLGEGREDLPGLAAQFIARIHSADRDAALGRWRALTDGRSDDFDAEFRLRVKRAEWLWIHARGRVLRAAEDGTPREAGGTLTDITRRKYDQLIVEAEHRLARTLERASDRASMCDALLDALVGLPEVDGGGVYWQRDDGGYGIVAHRGASARFLAAVGQHAPDSPRTALIKRGVMFCACSEPSARCESSPILDAEEVREEGLIAVAFIPIMVDGVAVACLNLGSRHVRTWSSRILDALESLALQFGQTVQRFQARDEAERQRRAIVAEKAFSDHVIESLPGVFIMLDAAGRMARWNSRLAEVTGIPPTELPGLTLDRFFPPEHLDAARASVARLFADGSAVLDAPLLTAKGEVPYYFRAHRTEIAGARYLVGFGVDVSAEKAAEAALAGHRRREKLFTALVEEAHDWMGFVDPETGKMLEFNAAAYRNLGYTQEEFARFGVRDIDAVQTSDEVLRTLAGIVASGSGQFETRHRGKDGAVRDVRVGLRVVEDGGRKLLAAVVTDLTEHKAALRRLAARDAELSRAQALALIGSWTLDIATERMTISQEARRIFGLRGEADGRFAGSLAPGSDADPTRGLRERFTLDAFRDALHPDDRATVWTHWVAGLKGASYAVDHRIVVNGETRWVRELAEIDFGPDGRALTATGTTQDITAQRATDERLRGLSQAVEQSTSGILITDLAGTIQYVNDAFCVASGYSSAELVGQNPRILKAARTCSEAFDGMWDTLTTGRSWRGEFWNRRKDGVSYPVEAHISPIRDAEGRIWRYLAAQEDVTQRRRVEAEVRKLSQAVAQSPASILITDLDARIEYVNEAFEATSGFSRAEVIGQNPRMLGAGRTPPETHRALWEALTAGRSWRGEFINTRKDGTELIESAIIAPIREPDGRVTHYVGVKQDITEQTRIARELEQHRNHLVELVASRTAELADARGRAEAANQAKSAFLANMSHEIRTPMNAIIGFSHLLGRRALTPDQRDKVNKIDAASRHLLQLINDVLDFSKIEAGKMAIERIEFDARQVVRNTCEVLSERALEKQLELDHQVDPDVPSAVVGDPLRIMQVLMNLGSNAIKFTDRGAVRCRVAVASRSGDAVVLRFDVEDSGIGIATDQIERLFEPFEQADTSTTRSRGGSGLGLTISRRLVGLMGGRLGASSKLGAGSLFWFELPLTLGGARAVAHAGARDHCDHPGRARAAAVGVRVLLVDDDAINRQIVAELLVEEGYDVETAENGADAIMRADGAAFDLVLMDMHMPEMDGLDAARVLRQNPTTARMPIIAMSASAFEEDRRRCLAAGMNDFVAKPIEPARLFDAVRHWVKVAPVGEAGTAPSVTGARERPTTAFASIPGLDIASGLRVVQGRMATWLEVLRTYIDQREGAAGALLAAVTAGEVEAARGLAHALKGAAGNIGASEVRAAAGSVERLLADGVAPEDVRPEALALCATQTALIGALRAALADRETGVGSEGPRPDLDGVLRELEALVTRDDVRAVRLWREHEDRLRERFGAAAEPLGTALARYDFTRALGLVRALHASR